MPFDDGFVDDLVRKLEDLHGVLQTRPFEQSRQACRDLLGELTESDNADHRIGVEQNKLLQPNWYGAWKFEHPKIVYTALFFDLPVTPARREDLYDLLVKAIAYSDSGGWTEERKCQVLIQAIEDYLDERAANDEIEKGARGEAKAR